jgi:hypothetical protein
MSGVGLRPALDGAWLVLTDGGPIRAASLIEAERIMAELREAEWLQSVRD